MTPTETPPRVRPVTRLAQLAAELGLAAALLFAIDAFAHRKLTVRGFGLVLAGWIVARIVSSRAGRAGTRLAIELLVPGIWLLAVAGGLKQPWTGPQMVYAIGLVALAWRGLRWLLDRAEARGIGRTGEMARLLLVGATTLLVLAPFVTDLPVGGSDATWYTGVFTDFVRQLRAGFFPVFVGQGEWAFNGSVNLFRSAPLCLWLGGLGDLLTAQSLSPIAIRNLALVVAGLAAAFGMYAAQVRLLPALGDARVQSAWARWLAALGALLYILSPAVLVPLYAFELQMTFTALLALPWVFQGNVRALAGDNGGYVAIAVGLSLAWLAHAPLAIIATLGTAALQLGHFIFEPAAVRRQGWAALAGALLFALLSAYYFLGMSEVETGTQPALSREAGLLAGITLVVLAGVQGFYFRAWPWLAGALAGGGLVAWAAPAWLPWVVGWLGLWAAVTATGRWWRRDAGPARAVLLAAVTMLVAAALAQAWLAGRAFAPHPELMREMANVVAARADVLRPLSRTAGLYADCQPGYALLAVAAASLALAWWSRRAAPALLAAVAGLLLVMLLAVPAVSTLLIGHAPPQIGHLVNLPMLYRLGPPFAALVVLGGFVAFVEAGAARRRMPAAVLAFVIAGVAWSAWEARRIPDLGFTRTASRALAAQAFSPDNYILGRYTYLMLYTPVHYMDGRHTAWMNTRLLADNRDQDLLVGPDEVAKQAEEGVTERFPLTSKVSATDPHWLELSPGWAVPPGESLVLRFEFAPGMNPAGWLILRGQHGYQEHYLDPGYPGTGFGAGPAASHAIDVTNSRPETERYALLMKMAPGNNLPRDGGAWGWLHISRYDPDAAPVKVESLLPYRARVQMPRAGLMETPRQWLAGYRAWVDGVRTNPVRLKSGMLGVPLTAGTHAVVVKFTGSARLWTGLVISAVTGLGLLAWWLRRVGATTELARVWREWSQAHPTEP